MNENIRPIMISNIYQPTHGTGYAGGVWGLDGISPTVKSSEYKGQTFIIVEVNDES